jgi:hypothetical protein
VADRRIKINMITKYFRNLSPLNKHLRINGFYNNVINIQHIKYYWFMIYYLVDSHRVDRASPHSPVGFAEVPGLSDNVILTFKMPPTMIKPLLLGIRTRQRVGDEG